MDPFEETPISRKLGIKEGRRVLLMDPPVGFARRLDPLPDPRILRYEPRPKGLYAARQAVAAYYAESRGAAVDPERIVLTASTSEAYALLFKLLCDPGDRVLVPEPSYPLFGMLTALEGVEAVAYPLRFDGEWHVDAEGGL